MYKLIDKLVQQNNLTDNELLDIIKNDDGKILEYLCQKATLVKKKIYGEDIYIRGLIEITNICKNDCLYCGIRRSNQKCQRYRLAKSDILKYAENGYNQGYRTFVLQGGEDTFYTDEKLCDIVSMLKQRFPDSCITLSMGERSKESYQKLYNAGAERYLLRHETATRSHYKKLHPLIMSFDNRIKCLCDLKRVGFQTGCGFMVGAPFQTEEMLVADLRFIKEFEPEMCGIGPFIPHRETQFKLHKAGSLEMTLKMLAIVRLLLPNVLLPATTALATINPKGRELGLKAGANVIMPNLVPRENAEKYALYDNKLYETNDIEKIKQEVEKTGHKIVVSRGDYIEYKNGEKNV